MIPALDRKLLRDLRDTWGPSLAIALVIGAGIGMYIMSISVFDSLRVTQETYYDRYRFADVFASLKRGPQRLEERIAEIPGVQRVQTRVVVDVTIDVEGLSEPAVGRLISLPDAAPDGTRPPSLNDVALLSGRLPDPRRSDETLVNEGFALARELGEGDSIAAVINGRRRQLRIVGVALSPEYIYTVRPGEFLPDNGRFGLFWMNRRALAAAFNMEGGFNDVSLRLMRGADTEDVIARLDRLIEPYGGLGAIPRRLQISHWWVDDQITQLRDVGRIMPVIFLGVAAFLLNVVLTRTVQVQRGQIAALKALGYANREIGMHYFKWALAISAVGAVFGLAFGAWMGTNMIEMQNEFFRFPFLDYRIETRIVATAFFISLLAAVFGALRAVRGAVTLPPAEAMQPEPPGDYRPSLPERLGLGKLLAQPTRMILRNIQRRPLRALTSITGIAFSVAILITGTFSIEGFDELLDVQYNVAQRQDVTVNFVEPLSRGALFELDDLPGVMRVEPMRAVAVELRAGHLSRQTSITGLEADASLNRVIDADVVPVVLPPEGLVVSATLADLLGIRRGDLVTIEVLEGRRPTRRVRVAELVDEFMGLGVYMEKQALHRLMREAELLSGAYLQVDERFTDTLYHRLKRIPKVAGVVLKTAAIQNFDKIVKETMAVSIMFNILFAAIIAFGVVYNTARISLSERARELASLRVLGFTRGEISYILLGELALLTLVAIPFGLLLGYAMAASVVQAYATEVYRIPLLITPRVYGLAATTVLVAAVVSSLVVRRRLDRLDLVEVLKTRE